MCILALHHSTYSFPTNPATIYTIPLQIVQNYILFFKPYFDCFLPKRYFCVYSDTIANASVTTLYAFVTAVVVALINFRDAPSNVSMIDNVILVLRSTTTIASTVFVSSQLCCYWVQLLQYNSTSSAERFIRRLRFEDCFRWRIQIASFTLIMISILPVTTRKRLSRKSRRVS